MVGRYYRLEKLGPREQAAWMRAIHPGFLWRVSGGYVVCRGMIQPTPLSHRYQVRVEYQYGRNPTVWVETPRLRRRQTAQRIPHTYSDNEPCLFYPGAGEWRSDKKIALTIIPWLATWLFYYELWLTTDEWKGGGIHPPASSSCK